MGELHYRLKLELQSESGHVWSHEYERITLDEFEQLYGDNIYKILSFEMRLIG